MAVLIISLIQIKGCKVEISDQEYLQSLYAELDKIKSEESVIKAYEVRSAPTFFILDENRVITKVLNGYGEGTTDNMSLEA